MGFFLFQLTVVASKYKADEGFIDCMTCPPTQGGLLYSLALIISLMTSANTMFISQLDGNNECYFER